VKKVLLKICDCFFLLRIPLLVPVWTVLVLGWITGSNKATPGGWIFRNDNAIHNEYILWIAFVCFSLIVASIYVLNQISDIESDRINRKLFILPNGLISVRTAWVLTVMCAFLGIAGGIIFLDKMMVILFIISLVLGGFYNLPPVNLKNRAFGGVVANFLGHGVLTYLIGWYAAYFGYEVTIALLKKGVVASLSAGFANAAVFLATTVPDATGDKSTGKRTFCVAYGEKKTALAAAVSCAFALLFSFTLEYNAWVMIIPSAFSLLVFIIFALSAEKEFAFKTFRWPVIILSIFVVIFIPLYGGIILITLILSRIYYKKRFNIEYPTLKSK
jgi:4-hydroxybenzoate polyprenyltransferase